MMCTVDKGENGLFLPVAAVAKSTASQKEADLKPSKTHLVFSFRSSYLEQEGAFVLDDMSKSQRSSKAS